MIMKKLMIKNKKFSLMYLMIILGFCTLNAEHDSEAQSNWYVDVDYLFWKADSDGLIYALVVPGGPFDNIIFANNIITAAPRGDGHSGVRVIGGYEFCDEFDTRIGFTFFNPCSCSSVQEENGVFMNQYFGVLNDTNLMGSAARSTWNVKLMSLDWEFGYNWEVAERLALRPHLGLKWAKIRQQQAIVYSELPEGLSDLNVLKCNKFSGVGPRIGIDAQWCIWGDLSIVGNFSGALLYGDFKISNQFNAVDQEIEIHPTIINCPHELRPTTQMFIGLNWNSNCWCTEFDIAVGYEAQYWWNQWLTTPSLVTGLVGFSNKGDLSTHGLTARFGINF